MSSMSFLSSFHYSKTYLLDCYKYLFLYLVLICRILHILLISYIVLLFRLINDPRWPLKYEFCFTATVKFLKLMLIRLSAKSHCEAIFVYISNVFRYPLKCTHLFFSQKICHFIRHYISFQISIRKFKKDVH
ncbi:hypothetical protein ABH968_001471 [Lysinibacillus sp. RC79]